MKIKFTSLPTSGGKIQVSFDGGSSFTDYNVEDVRKDGIPLDDKQDYSLIQIKSPSTILQNLDVVRKICLSAPEALSSCSFITDMTVDSRWPYCVTGIVLPDGITEIVSAKREFYGKGESSVALLSDMFPNLRTVTIPDGVTSIGESAFSGCTGLTSITIPNSVTSISGSAFSGCLGLTSITIPEGVTTIGEGAFYNCSSLTSINIPDNVTSISSNAFYNCSNLTSINIPESVTSIGDDAFSDCSSLTSITIPDGVTSIGQSAFDSCSGLTSISIPDGVTEISSEAFKNCPSLTSITIPDSVTSIGYGAFWGCSNLTSIEIPDSVTKIGGDAFYGCKSLTSITIPSSVTSISGDAFRGCSGLNVIIGNGVTSIESWAFNSCSSLASITIPDGVTTIGEGAFYNCKNLTSMTIPGSVTSIGSRNFEGCSKLVIINYKGTKEQWDAITKGNNWNYGCPEDMVINFLGEKLVEEEQTEDVPEDDSDVFVITQEMLNSGMETLNTITTEHPVCKIADGVSSIDSNAFRGCNSLTSITIPESVTEIGDYAFSGSSLTSVTIPNSVTKIGEWAFNYCIELKTINYAGTEEQWNAITKGYGWKNGCPVNMLINYNYEG